MMTFGVKPKKPNLTYPGDKCRISLLNSDIKIKMGIEVKRFQSTADHSISPLQLVTGAEQ